MGRGALVFKGDKPKKKKKKKSKHGGPKSDGDTTEAAVSKSSEVAASNIPRVANIMPPVIKPKASSTTEQQQQPQMIRGSGRITSSGTVVTGHDTSFEKEFQAGDAMVVTFTSSETGEQQQEMRVIKMRLSNTSCGISSAFSTNLSTPTEFFLMKKPSRSRPQPTAAAAQLGETPTHSFGTFEGGKFVYRERTEHGSYRIKSEDVADGKSRSELLRMRSKKTSDKYC